jgi:hypothetical protein
MLARLEMRAFALGNCLILLPGSNLDLECIKINTQMIVDVVNQVRLAHATGGLGGSHLVIGLVTEVHLVHTCPITCTREGIPVAPSGGGWRCEVC